MSLFQLGLRLYFCARRGGDGKGWFGQLRPHGSVQLRWYGHAGMETGGRISGGVGFLVAADTAEICIPQLFFLTKEYIHAIPHRQPWLHGAYLQSFDTTTTLMKLFLLAYRLQVMT